MKMLCNHYKDMILSMIKKRTGTDNCTKSSYFTTVYVYLLKCRFLESSIPEGFALTIEMFTNRRAVITRSLLESLKGWENPQTVTDFVKFVRKIVLGFKKYGLSDYSISEPVTSIIGGGYVAGLASRLCN